MKRLIIFLLLVSYFVSSSVFAGNKDFNFRRFTAADGLSSNTVRAILQDKRGYVWFGTDEGLNRYDGTGVNIYQYTTQTTHGLGCNYISALYEGEDELWVGTGEGLYLYAYDTNTFSFFEKQTSKGKQITTAVNDIKKDKEDNLWLATSGQGVFKYNRQMDKLEQYEFTACVGFVPGLCIDNENWVWAVTNQGDRYIYKLNKAENKFEPFELKYEEKRYKSPSIVAFEDTEHNLWLGTWGDGLQKIDRYSGQVTIYLHPSEKEGIMHIHSIMQYAPHQLLIGSDDGLSSFNTSTGEHKLYSYDEVNPSSLSNRFVYPIMKDREGGVWIGTYYGGVNYISPNTGQFESYSQSRFFNSVKGSIISHFCEDTNGNIWIASDDGGLTCLSTADNRFIHYMPQEGRNSLSYHNVHALCMDGDNLWIGTYTGGVNVLNVRTGVFKQYTSYQGDPKSLDGSSSYAIFKDREQRIWVATMSGINLYNREEDNFIRVKQLGGLTIDIDQDTKGNLWFATQGRGLFKYDPQTDSWKNYQHSKQTGALISDQVNCVLVDRNGQIWVGTMDGLCRYDVEKDQFDPIELDIPSHNICCIIEDERTLWMTTTKGLVRYIPGENYQVFMKSDGLQSDQFMPNAGMKTSNGKIYVGSVNGFNAFYPFQIHSNEQIPSVVITGLEIFNKEISVGDKWLPRSLDCLDELKLSYKDNVFSLRYAALSYCTPEKNQYAYKLDGFDKDWNYVGAQNKATYTNLPAGTYLFRVKASNNDGLWNDQGVSLKVVIYPPFYWTTAFKILYFILLCVALGYFIRFMLKRTEKKHVAAMNKLTENKEKEMHEAKIKFFTMIAHEIRTPVSLIIGPLEKIRRSTFVLPDTVRDDLNIIDRNSQRLLVLVNQLLDFRKVEREGIRIRCVPYSVYQLLKAVSERFEPTIVQQGGQLKVNYPNEDFVAVIDPEAITKVISNLLTNASKYTKNEVVLSCMVNQESCTFTIKVTDNGMGISQEDQEKIFKPFYQAVDNKPGTGLGLSIVKSIVDAHKGNIEVQSVVGKGSSFVVILPIECAEIGEQDSSAENADTVLPKDILSDALPVEAARHKSVMLIVDDNKEMLSFLSNSFSDQYNILTAEDGGQAMEILKENDVTLIVSDWMMPRMNGGELCRAVRSNQTMSHIPFILLTAKTDVNSKIEGMNCGADAFIEKPFSLQYLEACIKNIVDLRKLLRQKFSEMPLMPLNSIAGNSSDEKFLTKMNEIIEQNFSNPELSVDYLAEQLCISRSGLFAKIKSLANITPNELIQLVRLKKAAVLLTENQYRISEISYMVGFNNPSYFAKCFQKQFGMKPGEFLEKSNEQRINGE